MPHISGHYAGGGADASQPDFSIIGGGGASKPSRPSKPSSTSDYFGSMYTTPDVQTGNPSTDENIQSYIDSGAGGGGSSGSGSSDSGSSSSDSDNDTTTNVVNNTDSDNNNEEEEKKAIDAVNDFFVKIGGDKKLKKLEGDELDRVREILSRYSQLEAGPLKSRAIQVQNILDGVFGKEQRFTDMEGNRIETGGLLETADGLIDPNTGELVIDKQGLPVKGNKSVRFSREGVIDVLKDEFGDDILNRLKKDEKADFYLLRGMPQTTGGLADLAQLDANDPKNAAIKEMIFNARSTLGQKDSVDNMGNPRTSEEIEKRRQDRDPGTGGGESDDTDDTQDQSQFFGYNLGPAPITYPGTGDVFVDPSQGPLQSLFVNNYQGNTNNVGIATAADGMFVDNEPSLPLKLQDIKYEKRTNMMRNMDRIQPETNVMQGNMDLAPNLNRGI